MFQAFVCLKSEMIYELWHIKYYQKCAKLKSKVLVKNVLRAVVKYIFEEEFFFWFKISFSLLNYLTSFLLILVIKHSFVSETKLS